MVRIVLAGVLAAFLVFSAVAAIGAPVEIPAGSKCHACGMKIDVGGPFEAQIVQDGQVLGFCDIGGMLYFWGGPGRAPGESYVRDFDSKEWVAAQDAMYVKDDRFSTPMGWNIAVFASPDEARKAGSPMSFEEAVGEVRK